MPDYTWVCHACKEANNPGAETCRGCGFPAVASADEIEQVATGIKRPRRQTRKEWEAARRADLAALPLWKKPFAYALQVVRLVGAVMILGGIFDLSIWGLLFGLGVVAIAELLFRLLKGRPYVWEAL